MPGEARVHEMGDAVGEDARLARAGAREHEQRAFAVGHGGALLVVETLEQRSIRSASPALTSPSRIRRRPAGTLPAMRLTEEVRRTAQEIAAGAQWVTVDESALDAVERAAPPAARSRTATTSRAPPEDVATYLAALDTINFGSGWFPTLRKRPGMSGYFTMAPGPRRALPRPTGRGSHAELRAMTHRGDRRHAGPGPATTS